MRFPRAHEGVKLILIAEIIAGIDIVLLPVCTFALQLVMEDMDSLLGIKVLAILGFFAAGLLSICSLVLLLVGLHKAGTDEQRFQNAMTCAIVSLCAGLVLGVCFGLAAGLAVVIADNAAMSAKLTSLMVGLVSVVSGVLSCGVMHYIASGVRNLARKLGDEPMAAGCTPFQRTIAVLYGLTILIGVASALTRSGGTFNTLLSVISPAVSVASVIVILVFLNNAKDMLAQ